MKQVFSFLMMVLSLLVGFQQAIIIMHFNLNQEAIEQEFCVNRNRPELQCHGTCHLKKQLQEKENTDSAPIGIYQRIDMLAISATGFEAGNVMIEIRNNISVFKEIYYMEPCLEIFVPPPIA
ncbi:hypothetical protein GCM10011386_37580 [Parapedobacter defluvii]|uniref:Uncharacterized protein n=1 Tax=Parapedobacter defluvii TaxID=2045106 RepID=A0ABQ1MKB5_9SPHI|nr:hypothetical protein [Parapedobacter defluvii]GGC41936.1 hypothetical protein GCM10011386_37580 [Parapedobacter defluvii]